MLAEVFGQVHPLHMGIGCHQTADGPDGIIGGRIVDQNDLIPVLGQRLHRSGDLRHHISDGMLRAIARNHIGNFLHLFLSPFLLHSVRPFIDDQLFGGNQLLPTLSQQPGLSIGTVVHHGIT